MKLTDEQLAAIKDRDVEAQEAFWNFWDDPRPADNDRHALLGHIAALQSDASGEGKPCGNCLYCTRASCPNYKAHPLD